MPLWQAAQPDVSPVWFMVAPTNEVVLLWQVSHGWVDGRWFAGLPNAVCPLWHVAQPDVMPV